jgi:hypothetical protein
VQRLFDQRFDTRRRSIMLVNDARDPDGRPLATASNLQDALKGLGRILDRREDVLFLYLTGHGSRDGYVAVRFPPLPPDELDADRLAALLKHSRLGARVVVISACYSGTFVEPLHDDWTVVMTAAAADRTSFGCADDADYTYFGRALFAEALPERLTFPAAFRAARASVSARERREHDRPSLPQYAAGGKALARLARLDARLGLHDAPPAGVAARPAAVKASGVAAIGEGSRARR